MHYTGRYWEMVQRLKVNHFYTSPSAIRKLMKADRNYADNYDLSSLKTIASGNVMYYTNTAQEWFGCLYTVGEPLPTAAWKWFYREIGKENCVLVDTYWQTGKYCTQLMKQYMLQD